MRFPNWLFYVSLCTLVVMTFVCAVSVVSILGMEMHQYDGFQINFDKNSKKTRDFLEKKTETIFAESTYAEGDFICDSGRIKYENGQWVIVEAKGEFYIKDRDGAKSGCSTENSAKIKNNYFKVNKSLADEFKLSFNSVLENRVVLLASLLPLREYGESASFIIDRKKPDKSFTFSRKDLTTENGIVALKGFTPENQCCDLHFTLPKKSISINSKGLIECLYEDGLINDDQVTAMALSFEYSVGELALLLTGIVILLSVLLPPFHNYYDNFNFGESRSRSILLVIVGIFTVAGVFMYSIWRYFTFSYQGYSILNFLGMKWERQTELLWFWLKPLAFPVSILFLLLLSSSISRWLRPTENR